MRHPLHPAIVHFPVACWTLATACDLAGLWLDPTAWAMAGKLLLVGCVMALLAAATGLLELARLPEAEPALRAVHHHAGAALAALACYGTSLFLRLDAGKLAAPGQGALVASVAGLLCLAIAGWLGGTLVYRHRLGGEALRR